MQTPASLSPGPPAPASAPRPPFRERAVVLVGMMGAGKSWLGARAADKLALPFHDSDEELARAAQCSIADMFQRFGEAHFRAQEYELFARLLGGAPSVIAAGGGAFAHAPTHALIQAQAVSVWLQAERATLLQRLAKEPHKRPLLPRDPAQLPAALDKFLAARQDWYRRAHIILTPAQAASPSAAALLEERLKAAGAPAKMGASAKA